MLSLPIVLLASLTVAAAPVPAAKPDPGFGMAAGSSDYLPLLLLRKAPVQKELALSPEQLAKIKQADKAHLDRVRTAFRNTDKKPDAIMRDLAKQLDDQFPALLTEAQYPRFRQLVWQVYEDTNGPVTFLRNPVVESTLKLTDDQKQAVAKAEEELQTERASTPKRAFRAGPPTAEEIKAAEEKIAARTAKLVKLLTDDQKKKWNELQGEPFKGAFSLQPGMRPLVVAHLAA